MKRWLRLTLFALGLLLVVGLAVLALFARAQAISLIRHPRDVRHAPEATPLDHGLPYEEVSVRSSDGLDLVGWYLPTKNGAVVMAQHGYKSDREEFLEEAAMLQRAGFGVLVTTVRAHDLSDGELISFGFHEMKDLHAWYQWLLGVEGVDEARIGILGNSMGGSLVIQFASQNAGIRAVVAHSPFSSMDDTVATSIKYFTGLPAFPFAPMIVFWAEQSIGVDSSEISAREWIAAISPRPVLILQGGQDTVVSADSGQLLFEAAGEPKELWFEPALGHTAFDTELPEAFERRVVGFYETYLLADS